MKNFELEVHSKYSYIHPHQDFAFNILVYLLRHMFIHLFVLLCSLVYLIFDAFQGKLQPSVHCPPEYFNMPVINRLQYFAFFSFEVKCL